MVDGSIGPVQQYLSTIYHKFYLGPSINGLVTDGNTKLCCCGFFLALFQSTAAIKIDGSTGPVQHFLSTIYHKFYLGPSINGLVTDRNTKLCCRGFF